MNTFQIAGRTFKVTNPLPEDAMHKLITAVCTFEATKEEERFTAVDKIFNYIAQGHFGRVYDLGDYILKINKPWVLEDSSCGGFNARDGFVYEQLQGIPCIPTLYNYSTDNVYMVVQKIKGETVRDYEDSDNIYPYDFEKALESLDTANEMINERGWTIDDMHSKNCMIDEEGKFWMVDIGLFYNHENGEDGMCGREYHNALSCLKKLKRYHEDKIEDQELYQQEKKAEDMLDEMRKQGFHGQVTAGKKAVERPDIDKDKGFRAGHILNIRGNDFIECNLAQPLPVSKYHTEFYRMLESEKRSHENVLEGPALFDIIKSLGLV